MLYHWAGHPPVSSHLKQLLHPTPGAQTVLQPQRSKQASYQSISGIFSLKITGNILSFSIHKTWKSGNLGKPCKERLQGKTIKPSKNKGQNKSHSNKHQLCSYLWGLRASQYMDSSSCIVLWSFIIQLKLTWVGQCRSKSILSDREDAQLSTQPHWGLKGMQWTECILQYSCAETQSSKWLHHEAPPLWMIPKRTGRNKLPFRLLSRKDTATKWHLWSWEQASRDAESTGALILDF